MREKWFSKRREALDFAIANAGALQEFVDEKLNWSYVVYYRGND